MHIIYRLDEDQINLIEQVCIILMVCGQTIRVQHEWVGGGAEVLGHTTTTKNIENDVKK